MTDSASDSPSETWFSAQKLVPEKNTITLRTWRWEWSNLEHAGFVYNYETNTGDASYVDWDEADTVCAELKYNVTVEISSTTEGTPEGYKLITVTQTRSPYPTEFKYYQPSGAALFGVLDMYTGTRFDVPIGEREFGMPRSYTVEFAGRTYDIALAKTAEYLEDGTYVVTSAIMVPKDYRGICAYVADFTDDIISAHAYCEWKNSKAYTGKLEDYMKIEDPADMYYFLPDEQQEMEESAC